MTHADSLAVDPSITDKAAFYAHVTATLSHLLAPDSPTAPKGSWVTGLANASSLLYGSYENFKLKWGKKDGKRVNWTGACPRFLRAYVFLPRGVGGDGGLTRLVAVCVQVSTSTLPCSPPLRLLSTATPNQASSSSALSKVPSLCHYSSLGGRES